MTWKETDFFFSEHLFNIFFSSILRSIKHARSHPGEEGILAALGLLCYTEAVGQFVPTKKRRKNTDTFNTFFDRLGTEYADFRKSLLKGRGNVYDILRCGLAHHGFTKEPCRIRTVKGREACGVWKVKDGKGYVFSVEKYFEDFEKASQALYLELLAEAHPELVGRSKKAQP